MNRVAMIVLGWLVAATLMTLGFMVVDSSSPTSTLPVVHGVQAPNTSCVANTGDPTFFELRLSRLYAEASGSVIGYVKGVLETLPIAEVLENERTGVFSPTDLQVIWVCTN